jgi:hypothetical protein
MKNRKIFNISMHRSAGQSFHNLCQKRDILSMHYPPKDDNEKKFGISGQTVDDIYKNFLCYIPNYQAFSDTPISIISKKLIKNFSKDLFLLITRNEESWAKSVIRNHESHVFYRGDIPQINKSMYSYLLNKPIKKADDLSLDDLIFCYNYYNSSVIKFAKRNNADLTILNLEDLNFSQKINIFLDSISETSHKEFANIDYIKNFRGSLQIK